MFSIAASVSTRPIVCVSIRSSFLAAVTYPILPESQRNWRLRALGYGYTGQGSRLGGPPHGPTATATGCSPPAPAGDPYWTRGKCHGPPALGTIYSWGHGRVR